MKLRSGKIFGMAEDDATQPITVTHTLTNFKSGIEPFAGRVNGELRQGVEVFIDSIDNHLNTKKITDPREAFVEAKAHFNLSQGDLGECSRSIFYRDCTTWEDLKGFLRATYGTGEQKDLVLGLRQVLKLHNRKGNSFVTQNAKINDGVVDFITNLGNSDWADLNGKRGISLKNLGRLLQLSVGLLSLPDALVNTFDAEFSPTATENDVMAQISKNVGKMAVPDSTILRGVGREGRAVSAVSRAWSSRAVADTSSRGSRQSGTVGGGGQKKGFKCFNCGREGHVKMNCMVRYCGFHQSSNHNWKECKSLNAANRVVPGRDRSRSRESGGRNQSGGGRFGGSRSGSRPPSPSRSNFLRGQKKGGKG